MSIIIYDGSKQDENGVFMHSITENNLLKSGRLKYKHIEGVGLFTEFTSYDKDFPSKEVFVHDGLEEGKIFSRKSPPVITEDDFRIVDGGRDEITGEMLLTFYLDKLNIGKVFGAKDIENKRVYESFRRDLEFKYSEFEVLLTV